MFVCPRAFKGFGGLAPLASLDPKSVFCLLKIGPLVRFFLLVLPGRGRAKIGQGGYIKLDLGVRVFALYGLIEAMRFSCGVDY